MSTYKLSAPLAVVMGLLMSFRLHDMCVTSEITTEEECRPQTSSFLSKWKCGFPCLLTNERGIKETRPMALKCHSPMTQSSVS